MASKCHVFVRNIIQQKIVYKYAPLTWKNKFCFKQKGLGTCFASKIPVWFPNPELDSSQTQCILLFNTAAVTYTTRILDHVVLCLSFRYITAFFEWPSKHGKKYIRNYFMALVLKAV